MAETAVNRLTVEDDQGRKLTIKEPDFLTDFNFPLVLGDAASNEAYLQRAQLLIWIESIDEQPVPLTTKREVDAFGTAAIMRRRCI